MSTQPQPKPPTINPVASLLLTNLVFWGGLFGVESLHSRLARPLPAEPQPPLVGLHHLNPAAATAGQLPQLLPQGTAAAAGTAADHGTAAALKPLQPDTSAPEALEAYTPAAVPLNLMQQLQQADGLGGPITRASLMEPAMPAAARAERLGWARSGDPLSPLPLHWRGRIQQELSTEAQAPVARAELVRLPVAAAQQREEVAVLINDSGSAVGLQPPQQPAVVAAVEAWASRQQPAPAGTVHAVVIAAEPLPPEPTTPSTNPSANP